MYPEKVEWPLVNTFPDHIEHDFTAKVTLDDFKAYCQLFIVLSDFWKHWILVLKADDWAEFLKLDFNAEGNLVLDFTPHDAAVTFKDQNETRRFVVWNGYQLYGDVGERRGLKRKWPAAHHLRIVRERRFGIGAQGTSVLKSIRYLRVYMDGYIHIDASNEAGRGYLQSPSCPESWFFSTRTGLYL